ncbi:hypothetical protein CALCODRAFT_442071, partial [Calocera cornea HHB12733]
MKGETPEEWRSDNTIRLKKGQPRRDVDSSPIECYVTIGGHTARALIDSGAEIDTISAEFVVAHEMRYIRLDTPVALQQMSRGSRTVINYGVNADVSVGGDVFEHYFDVVNTDEYQVILGLPFCRRVRMILDIQAKKFQLGGPTAAKLQGLSAVPQGKLDRIRAILMSEIVDLIGDIPLVLPPLRKVNHKINLVDDKAVYRTRRPTCPDVHREELHAKTQQYVEAGWWQPAQTQNALPMLCITK